MIDFLIVQIRRRQVDKPLNESREDDLRQAGATSELIAAIKANSPPLPRPPTPAVTPTPVYLPPLSELLRTAPKAGEVRKNSIGMEIVWVPPGEFMMGSENGTSNEKPVHRVTIAQGFWMGKFEVTQTQYESVMGTNPSAFGGCGNCPVENVSWEDAKEFIAKLNARNDGLYYSLPTEAQWDYSARAGATGDYSGVLDDISWYANNSGRATLDADAIFKNDKDNYSKRIADNGGHPHPVGTKRPNNFGLFDTSGNVWEWCEDIYNDGGYAGLPSDGTANVTIGDSKLRVLRGGSWINDRFNNRSAIRFKFPPSTRINVLGFRVLARVR
jgi:formylglycine-generating enzyme required for sulfatase activity